jgi:hypothetical protein
MFIAAYFLIAALIALVIVAAIHFFWTSNIRDRALRVTLLVFISTAAFITTLVVPLLLVLPDFDDVPIVRKEISSNYYYTQKEFGFVTNMGGKDIELFRNRRWWFDAKLGDIRIAGETADIDASLIELNERSMKLSLRTKTKLLLDTTITRNRYFNIMLPTK